MSSLINYFHIIKYGTYFCPSYRHYSEDPIDVFCDRCSVKTFVSLGLGDNYDLCLDCVNELKENIKYMDIFTSGIFCCNMISYVSNTICDKCKKPNIKIYVSYNDVTLCLICIEKIMHKFDSLSELSMVKIDGVEILPTINQNQFMAQKTYTHQSFFPQQPFLPPQSTILKQTTQPMF